jgi:hypothetical protein
MKMLNTLLQKMMDPMMKWKISSQRRKILRLKDKESVLRFMVNSIKKEISHLKL